MMHRIAGRWIGAALLVALLGSCAYYNTFYLARKYYDRATGGLPYPVEAPAGPAANDFTRSIDYSKKLLAQYPKSKWVDDAYLLWARGLLGRDDPLQTATMLEDFPSRFPQSPRRLEALFYLGVAYRHARKYPLAVATLDSFTRVAPKSDLVPYAQLETSRALMSLDRPSEAAKAASKIVEKFPNSVLLHQAYVARAEARLAAGEYQAAQNDFNLLGQQSRTDDERLGYLLREAECLETARDFDAELALLQDALSHEIEPLRPDSGAVRTPQQQAAGGDRFGRILMRIGTAHLLAGRLDEALDAYRRIVEDYPKTPLGGEAQYRIGYALETAGDDFEAARAEYDKVKDQIGATGFGLLARQRAQNLDRLAQFRAAAGDTTEKRAEAGFALAEQYLFQLDKPNRAIEEYRKVSQGFTGTPSAAKALLAEGWVRSRKLNQNAQADSLFWKVVHEYPATEAQLAARDYLEQEGVEVPESLIKYPEKKAPPPPPEPLPAPAVVDTVLGPAGGSAGNGPALRIPRGVEGRFPRMPGAFGDSAASRRGGSLFAPPDSLNPSKSPPDSLPRPATAPDSLARPPASADSLPHGVTPVDSLLHGGLPADSSQTRAPGVPHR